MKTSSETATHPETFILAGRNEAGVWQKIESATVDVEEGETAEDVKVFLQTMAQASTRSYVEMEILTEAEFNARLANAPAIAA